MLLLSYSISSASPMYGNTNKPEFKRSKSMDCGDSCNQLQVTISNHTGTHLDCPSHFAKNGKTLTDYGADFWFAKTCAVIELEVVPAASTLIGADLLSTAVDRISNDVDFSAEVVLLKTGFGKFRGLDDYWQVPPGFQPDAADYLRGAFPKIRFFGFDLISLPSFSHRPVGREAHRRFLDHENPILILEDLNLREISGNETIQNVLISPLLLDQADGAPCSVWANVL